ncbi:MAG: hypothetical protein DRQ49_07965 [Gammaproteobacteria bacterium]|nr:MAG: hypothetical protein DRQ49_07965 [Gammaproteobacteria bacterium]
MIVLDEQLLGRNLELEIAKWYQGTVQFIIDLRPNTVVKDDAIPALLRRQNQATFVTINERNFWKKVVIDCHFCVVCFTLSDRHAHQIPQSLRLLYNLPEFDTKIKRMGKVIRVTTQGISYYTFNDKKIYRL